MLEEVKKRFEEDKKKEVESTYSCYNKIRYILQKIDENLTYDYLHASEDNLWSILYLTGCTQRSTKRITKRITMRFSAMESPFIRNAAL